MNHSEAIAKVALEAVLPGARLEYRVEQSHGEYDFHVRYPNGTVAALEVTQSLDQVQMRTSAQIRSRKKGGPVIQATKCQKSWILVPATDVKPAAIREKADGYLSRLEQARIETFSALDAMYSRQVEAAGIANLLGPVAPQCVWDICHDLKIMSGSVISAGGPPRIFIKHPVYGGAVGPSDATKAGEREASKEDNRKKLGAANTEERHLVVYIDAMNGLPWTALTDFAPPSTLPNLPEEITNIWLVAPSGELSEFVIWRASTKEPWADRRLRMPLENDNRH